MSHLHGYIETEDAKVRPLYRWNKYNNYGRLQRATEGLEAAVRALRVQIESIEDVSLIWNVDRVLYLIDFNSSP